jgi:hypothetical protein
MISRRIGMTSSARITAFVLLGLGTLPACSSLTPEGSRVRVTTNPDVVRGCEFLGNAVGSSGWGGPAGGNIGEDQVQIKMQNEAAKMGGNVLFLISNKAGGYGGSSRGVAEVYRCPVPPPR